MTDRLRLNVIYAATVGLRRSRSATTLEVLVPHSVGARAEEQN